MFRRALRAAALWAVYFTGVFAATLLALFGVSWAAGSWSADADFAHMARIALAVVVAAAVLHTLRLERDAHADPESQLG
ncbi:hypothetical protein [Methylibium petroleiphilum]|nr:hypothetical protein [Methylibium petroleiphilum]